MRRIWPATLVALSVALSSAAHAQSGKPIKMIVAFPPGGPVDLVARLLTDPLTKEMGQPIVVENKPGANGGIAAELVAKGPADGSVIFLTSSGATVINPSLYPSLPYDPMKDFAPVSRVVNSDTVLVVHPSNPATDAAGFAEASRKAAQSVPIGSAGIGSTTHLALELFQGASKANLLHVPYKGAAPVINDVISNQVGGFFGDLPGLIGHIQGGKLKPLGIAAPKRHVLLPDVKTFAELGFPGTELQQLVRGRRAGQDAAAVHRQVECGPAYSADDGARARQAHQCRRGARSSTPEEMAEVMKRDTAKFAKIIADKGIKADKSRFNATLRPPRANQPQVSRSRWSHQISLASSRPRMAQVRPCEAGPKSASSALVLVRKRSHTPAADADRAPAYSANATEVTFVDARLGSGRFPL